MKIQKKSGKGRGERGWGRKREGEDWQKGEGAPHQACALGPAHGDPALFRSNQISSTEVDWDT